MLFPGMLGLMLPIDVLSSAMFILPRRYMPCRCKALFIASLDMTQALHYIIVRGGTGICTEAIDMPSATCALQLLCVHTEL